MSDAHLFLLSVALVAACGDKPGDSASDGGTGESGEVGSGGGSTDGSGGSGGGDGGAGDAGGTAGGGSGGGSGGSDEGGGDAGGDDGGSDPLLLLGAWFDQEGAEHVISETLWLIDFGAGEQYSYAITAHDNSAGWVIGENGSGNVGEVGFWSRFDFRIDGGGTAYVCQSTGTAVDESAALATAPADAGRAPTSPCAYWGWQTLTPR